MYRPNFDPVKVTQAYENLKKNDPYGIAHEWIAYTFRDYYRTGDELLELIPCMVSLIY
jgi:hypothetical protein